jgi:hypothetical protein
LNVTVSFKLFLALIFCLKSLGANILWRLFHAPLQFRGTCVYLRISEVLRVYCGVHYMGWYVLKLSRRLHFKRWCKIERYASNLETTWFILLELKHHSSQIRCWWISLHSCSGQQFEGHWGNLLDGKCV